MRRILVALAVVAAAGCSSSYVDLSRFPVETCGRLSFGADGVAGPLFCPDGKASAAADRYYRALGLPVMRLGADAAPGDVERDMCQSVHRSTIPIAQAAYALQAHELRWQFAVDPASTTTLDSC